MSLKEAVSALRSLKTELEASRRANAELEAKNYKLAESFRAAGGAGIVLTENGHKDQDGETTPSDNTELEEERAAALRLRKELQEAQEAATRLEGERREMEEEARSAREELMTMTKHVADKSRELQEALSAKDEAIRAGEQALDRVKAAEDEATKQETRASAAEEQLSCVSEDAKSLCSRLEEMAAELESARDALSTERIGDPGESGGEGEEPIGVVGDEEDVAELESELRLVREAVTGQAPGASESATEPEFLRVAVEEARQRAERLQAELDFAAQETNQLHKSLENVQDRCRSAEDSAAAAAESLASEHERRMAENNEKIAIQEKLALTEDALREAEKLMASMEASTQRVEASQAAALEETKRDMDALKVALAEAVDDREDAKRLAAEEKAARVGEMSSLREELEMLRAELAKAEAWAIAAGKDAAEKTAVAASRVAELEVRLETAKEDQDAALKAATSKVLEMRRRESENAAAGEAKAAEVESMAEARVAEAVKARDAAEEESKKASGRASAAQTALARLKTKAAELKEKRAEAVRTAEEAQAERDSAVKAEATAAAARKDMEETLLMANKELQRLKVKCDKAIVEAEEARTESKRLEAELETSNLRVNTSAHGNKGEEEEDTIQGKSDAEIARLREKIAELEERDTETGEEDDDAESDRLRTELRQAREEAATRTAGLETQLADKEREAADTQRRLYLRQSELEAELEEVRVNYDALRVEMARMDASMQDVADSRYDATGTRGLTGRGSGSVGEDDVERKGFKDAAALGAEVGSAVGGIFKGKLWSGWGHADGAEEEARGQRRGEPFPVRARGRDDSIGAGLSSTSTAGRLMTTSGAGRRERVEDQQEESISRVRDNMMARLHEAAGHPMSNETMADTGDEDKDGDGRREEEKAEIMGGENGNASNENENLDVRAGRAGSMEGGWVEETVEHPAPDYGLSSPVIRYLLQQWSSDPEKLRYLSLWLRCVVERRKVPDAFPSGLQLVGLAPEIKDGFLTLVVPIIRHSGGVPVLVHSRRSPPDERDVANEEELWDLRVKVDLQRTVVRRSGELSDGSRETGGSVPSEGLSRRRARRSKGGAPTGKT